MRQKSKLHSLVFAAVLISVCCGHGRMAMAATSDWGSGLETTSRCNARTDEFSPLRDEKSVFPDPQDHEKLAIYRAIRCRDADEVRKLLDSGLDPNTNLSGGGLTYWAALAGSIPILKLLVERGGKINGVEGNFTPSPLHGAIGHTFGTDDWSVYEFLLSQGADPEIRCGNPTLTAAEDLTMVGRFDKIDELLDRGFDRDLIMLRHFVEGTIEVTPKDRKEKGKQLLQRLNIILQ